MLKTNNSLFVAKQIQSYFLNKSFLFKKINFLKQKPTHLKKSSTLESSKVFKNSLLCKKIKKFIFNNNKIFKQENKTNKSISPILAKLVIKNEILLNKNSFLYEEFLKYFLKQKFENNNGNFYLENLLLEIFKTKTSFFNCNELLFLKKFYVLLKKKTNKILLKKRALALILKKYNLLSSADNSSVLYFFCNKMILSYLKTSKQIKYQKDLFLNIEKLKTAQLNKKEIIANSFYKKFVGLCIKKGAKTKALKFVQETLNTVSQELGLSTNFILLKLLSRLKMSLELKTVRKKVRKTKKKVFHIVPYPIRKKRELFLIIKLILKSITKKNTKKSSTEKLSHELITLLKAKKKSEAFKIKRSIIQAALKNRSNKHFRW